MQIWRGLQVSGDHAELNAQEDLDESNPDPKWRKCHTYELQTALLSLP